MLTDILTATQLTNDLSGYHQRRQCNGARFRQPMDRVRRRGDPGRSILAPSVRLS